MKDVDNSLHDFPARELTNISFPLCHKRCAAVRYLGVGECENVCPKKFRITDEPPKKGEGKWKEIQ